jgi:hypothetical protein
MLNILDDKGPQPSSGPPVVKIVLGIIAVLAVVGYFLLK